MERLRAKVEIQYQVARRPRMTISSTVERDDGMMRGSPGKRRPCRQSTRGPNRNRETGHGIQRAREEKYARRKSKTTEKGRKL